jgi:hypothetical protein
MTALTVPARAGAGREPGRCRGGGWPGSPGASTGWRWHRMALAGVTVFLGALAVWLWRAGLGLHHAYAAAAACHPASSMACADLISSFNGMGGLPGGWLRPAGSARADRGVRGGAGAGPGA